MGVEQLSERMPTDRSAQILGLLSDVSERLRRAEGERDIMKREILAMREALQDIDERNNQTQKAWLGFENRFDGAENTVDGLVTRLASIETTLDGQSNQFLSILNKIDERFEAYDREYKNHAATIASYADLLDKFDKKIERILQDKGRLSRKVDALEFQLADTEDMIQSGDRASTSLSTAQEAADEMDNMAQSTIQVWSAESARPQFLHGPTDIPVPARKQWRPSNQMIAKAAQYGGGALFAIFLLVLGYNVIGNLLDRPAKAPSVAENIKTPERQTSTIPAPVTPNVIKPAEEKQAEIAAPSNSDLPTKDFFSKSIRAQIDQQMVEARKLEDEDAARLMSVADTSPVYKRLKRDAALPRAIKAIEAKAADGTPEAQHDMGALYTSGQSGVSVDYARAAFWFREAAQNGIANARYNLGVLYQQGLGAEKDIDQALSWYRAAALLEHPEARYNLGIAYVEGIGVAYNPAMAAGYFEQAARNGVTEAAYNLGLILENGLIDGARPYEALFWYHLAALGGSADATKSFDHLKSERKITDKDFEAMYQRMLTERPDLKALAESRKNGVPAAHDGADAPAIRIHMPTKTEAAPAAAGRPAPPPRPKLAADHDEVDAPARAEKYDQQVVGRIQTMLADEGLYKGSPDGVFGPATSAAIRRYQEKNALIADGKPSTTLMAQMLARRLAAGAHPASASPQSANDD